MKTILSLCDYSGVWSLPYLKAGYRVVVVDVAHPNCSTRDGKLIMIGADLRLWRPGFKFHGALAAPSCTCLSRVAAQWWTRQDARNQTAADIGLFQACLDICRQAQGWWALENPPGRHQKLIPGLGKPAWQFQPWEYGDPWSKQTYIWGTAQKPPVVAPVKPQPTRQTPNGKWQGRIGFMSSSWKRQRSQTPAGFAQAFFQSNP